MESFSEKTDRFADYFAVCGLDLKSGLELYYFSGETQLQGTPLDRSYKCKVLSHFPETVSWNPIDKDAICMLSLPSGLRFRTQKHKLEPEFHSFIVTKEDGRRCYGFSFVFYEKAHNKICSAMQTLQAMHLAEISGGPKKNASLNHNTRSLPRHFKIMSQHYSLVQSYYDIAKDVLYVTKAIVLISQYPYVYASYQFLWHLYKNWQERSSISLETYIYYLLNEVKVPQAGQTLKFYVSLDTKVTIRSPDLARELPFFDFPIRELFRILDVDSLLYLFTSILMENQVLICSSDYQQLMLVAETLNCLLFPFSWPHVYVPILPTSLEHFLDAPVPFIMGVSRSTNLNIPNEANLCFVDIETQSIQLPEDLLTVPNKAEFTSEIFDLLDQYNVPIRNCYRQLKSSEVRNRIRRSDASVLSKMSASMSSENLNFSLSSDDGSSLPNSPHYSRHSSFQELPSCSIYGSDNEDYVTDLCFNAAIRELFLNKFLHLFLTYERYIIQPFQDREQWISNKESVQSFDKASFLSEQPENFPFLSQFIETQMFTNFVDNKIQSFWGEKERNLRIFDERIKSLKLKHPEGQSSRCNFEHCSSINECQTYIRDRFFKADLEISHPEEIFLNAVKPQYNTDIFPTLNLSNLNKLGSLRSNKKVRLANENSNTSEARPLGICERLTIMKPVSQNSSPTHISPAVIAQTNWNFVDKLLKDCKTKTKKMLVAKMGYEAVELGHNMQNMLMEENTLIIGLCDLLERIWSHGCQNKQGKSALWYHLIRYKELEDVSVPKSQPETALHPSENEYVNSVPLLKTNLQISQDEDASLFILERLPVSLIHDMKYVETLTDIKTQVGLAKAWVRLSLEKKLLSRHLKTLLSNSTLLKNMYKRYAFLRCEEEKEQFLYHLLSLNAVDYYCFTNTYVNCRIPYRVLIHSSTKIAAAMINHCWIILSGNNGETEKVYIPKGKLEFVFQHKNLGLLTMLRIGQENRSLSLKWLVDWVIVRNEITGHIYSFPCGRWLGRGVDDDSSERLLIGKRITEGPERGRSLAATRIRSPSVPPAKPTVSDSELQQQLGECVNNIIKYYYGKPKENSSVGTLLCGENGLVFHMEQILFFGFRSSRLFGRNLYIWDFIIKVKEEKEQSNEGSYDDEVDYFCKLISEIQNSSHSLGKEGRFQVFICVTVRDHSINSVLRILSSAKITTEMYEEHSFLRKKSLFYFLTHLLDSLYDLEIFLENCLTLGIAIE
ncbi:DENN domain-containing protein 5B [Planococcus citri]|uniref:DENN domain-containing protein 5B n=1 Tax=Planococcus citri TaxID=170843 RepID=UPI0031F7FB82